MLTKFSLAAIGPFVNWLRRRREQRAMLIAIDELSHSRDDMLSDIGISRDDIMQSTLHGRRTHLEGRA